MTRLTNGIRENIRDKALAESSIPKREKALIKKRAEWAEAVRVKAVGGKETDRKLKAARTRINNLIKDLPESCVLYSHNPIRIDYDIFLNVGGRQFIAYFNGGRGPAGRKSMVYKITPNQFTLDANDPLTAAFEKLEREHDELENSLRDLSAEIWAVLSSVNTVKQLLEVWPESKKFLPKSEAAQKTGLPAVQIEDLNKKLGLSKK